MKSTVALRTRRERLRVLHDCGALITAAAAAAFVLAPVPAHDMPGRANPIRFAAPADPTYRADGWHTTAVATGTGRFDLVSKARGAFLPRAAPLPGDAQDKEESDAIAWGAAQALMGRPVGAVGLPVQLSPSRPGAFTLGATLRDGDLLLSVAGVPTPDINALITAVGGHSLGRTVPVTFVHAGQTHTVPVAFPAAGTAVSAAVVDFWGLQWVTTDTVPAFPTKLPLPVRQGGPSGGLLTTLAYLDASTPGDLTGGKTIAGTGTIALTGEVGEIGGAQFKIVGARDAGADVFFAPAGSNAREAAQSSARNHLGIPVVPVATIRQALDWLCAHGGVSSACTPPAPPGA